MNKIRSVMFFVLFLFMLVAWLPVYGTSVKIDPASKQLAVGESCSLDVYIENVDNLGGFQFDITYNTSVVHTDGVVLGALLGSTGRNVFPVGPEIDNAGATGKVTYGAATFGTSAGASGSGVLATIIFTAQADGNTPVNFSSLGISDINGQPITISSQMPGQITVGASPPPTEMAASFDGDGDYIDLGKNAVLDITDVISIECWVRHHNGDPVNWEDIVMKGNQTYGFQFDAITKCFAFHLTEGEGGIRKEWRNCDSNVQPNANEWYHLAGTFDGNEQKFYINGVLHNTCTWSGSILSQSDVPLAVANKVANDNAWGNLDVDELRIWHTVRTQRDIRRNMYQTLTGSEDGLAGYWPFDGNMKDLTGNSSDGVAYGDAVLIPSPMPPATKVTFRVTVPSSTPTEDVIYLAGDFNDWDPGPANAGQNGKGVDMPMIQIDPNYWQMTYPFAAGQNIEYRYTRGSWETAEIYDVNDVMAERLLTIPDQAHIQNDLVGSWYDIPVTGPWSVQTSGVESRLASVDAVSYDTGWITGQNGILLRTTDNGNTWNNVAGSMDTLSFASVAALDASTALVGAWYNKGPQSYDTYIFKTTNGGDSWSKVFEQQDGFIDNITMFDANNGMAVGDPVNGLWTILKTTDGGNSWSQIPNAPVASGGEYTYVLAITWPSQSEGWIGTNQPHAYRTTDGGNSWTTVSVDPLLTHVTTLAFSSFGVGLVGTGGTNKIARTTDGGTTWTEISVPGEGVVYYLYYHDKLYWLLHNENVYTSSDFGDTWNLSASSSANLGHLSLTTSGKSVSGWVVGRNGVILRYDSPTVKVEQNIQEDGPDQYTLLQNYPNPFNSRTTISFQVLTPGRVQLEVYDLIGRCIRHILDEPKQAGAYAITWNGRDDNGATVASGVYLYKISTGIDVQSRKMILLR